MKWLLLLIVIWLVWHLLRASRRAAEHATPPQPAPQPAPLAMRACAHCGLNVPENELLHDVAGAAYCCEAHRRLGAARSRS